MTESRAPLTGYRDELLHVHIDQLATMDLAPWSGHAVQIDPQPFRWVLARLPGAAA